MRPGPFCDSLPEHAMIPGGAGTHGQPAFLVVDDDPEMLRTLVYYFQRCGYDTVSATNMADAKKFFGRRKTWTMVIADYHLPDGTGVDLCQWIREQPGSAPGLLLMSGNAKSADLCREIDFLRKPFQLEQLETQVRAILRQRRY